MTPKFLYFDLGRVLLHFDIDRMACQMGLVAGVSADMVTATRFGGDLQHRYEAGQVTSDAFHEEFALATGARPDRAALEAAAGDIFEVNLPMLPVVAALHAARWPLGLLSNTCECHWRHCQIHYRFLSDLFGTAALSYEIGAVKPEPAIFEAAARLAGCPPEEIFFVDDMPRNVEGARAAGFDAIVYQSARHVADELRARGVHFNY